MNPKSVTGYLRELCCDIDAGRTLRSFSMRKVAAPFAVPAALGLALGGAGCLEPEEEIPEIETSCTDGIDNDLDGYIDCEDVDCIGDEACSMVALYAVVQPEDCTDGVDNDGDGWIDCDDEDCFEDPACSVRMLYGVPMPEQDCTDGLDNDRDGLIDCEDADCEGDPACEASPEYAAPFVP
jgi:hypothetical protein